MRTIMRQCAHNLLRLTFPMAVLLTACAIASLACAEVEGEFNLGNMVNKILAVREAKPKRHLDVRQCMSIALDQNKEIKEAWHLLQQTQVGDRIITRSRLFPQLEGIVGYTKEDSDITGTDYDDTQAALRLSQRILEYGKDAPAEVALRASQRSALYNFESIVRRVLAQVRRDFYVIILRDKQITKRRELLEEFREDYLKKKTRLEKREPSIEPSDVLQSETNVLEWELFINTLVRAEARLKMTLLQLMGESIGQNIELAGTQDETIFDVEEAIQIALKNSIEVARLREELEEQKRVLDQIWWEFAPDLSLQTGVSRRGDDVALDLSNSGDTWALDVTGERFFEPGDDREQLFVEHDDEDFFLNLEMRIPILEGFARFGEIKRERQRLKQAEARLERAREQAELNVRLRYENLLDQAEQVRLSSRRVEVSRRLYEIQNEWRERLPGRVSELQFQQFRDRYFGDQFSLFEAEADFVVALEALREAMGYFE